MTAYRHEVCEHGTIAAIREAKVNETVRASCPPSCPSNFGLTFTPKALPEWWREWGSGDLCCVHGTVVARAKQSGPRVVMEQAVSTECDACRWYERSVAGTLLDHKPTRPPQAVGTRLGYVDRLFHGAGRVPAIDVDLDRGRS